LDDYRVVSAGTLRMGGTEWLRNDDKQFECEPDAAGDGTDQPREHQLFECAGRPEINTDSDPDEYRKRTDYHHTVGSVVVGVCGVWNPDPVENIARSDHEISGGLHRLDLGLGFGHADRNDVTR